MRETMLKHCRMPRWRGGLGFAMLAGVLLLAWGLYDWYAFERQILLEERALEARRPPITASPPQEDRAYWDVYRNKYDIATNGDLDEEMKERMKEEIKNMLDAIDLDEEMKRGMKDRIKENIKNVIDPIDFDKYLARRDAASDKFGNFHTYVATFPEGVQAVWPEQVLTKDGTLFDKEMLLQRRLGHRESSEMKPGPPYLLKIGVMNDGGPLFIGGEWIYPPVLSLWSDGSLKQSIYVDASMSSLIMSLIFGDTSAAQLIRYKIGRRLGMYRGDDESAQLNTHPFFTGERDQKVQLEETRELFSDAIDFREGGGFHLVLRRNGRVWVIDGGNFAKKKFVRPVAGLTGATAIAAGRRHALALKGDGSVWMWGWRAELFGEHGMSPSGIEEEELVDVESAAETAGNGRDMAFARRKSVPQHVKGLPEAIKIEAMGTISLALSKDGTVWSWGAEGKYGEHGMLAPPTAYIDEYARKSATSSSNALPRKSNERIGYVRPFRIPELSDIVDISTDHGSALALKRDGTVWVWNPYKSATSTYRMGGFHDVKQIFGGYPYDKYSGYGAVVRQDGSLWCIGENSYRRMCRASYADSVRAMGKAGTPVDIHFSYREKQDNKNLSNEVGVFKIDDPTGRIGKLHPGDQGYALAALAPERAITLHDARTATPDDSSSYRRLELDGGQMLGFYFIAGGNIGAWRSAQRQKPLLARLRASLTSKPVAYFSYPAANLDGSRHADTGIYRSHFDDMGHAKVEWYFERRADNSHAFVSFLRIRGLHGFDERFLPRPPVMTSTMNASLDAQSPVIRRD